MILEQIVKQELVKLLRGLQVAVSGCGCVTLVHRPGERATSSARIKRR